MTEDLKDETLLKELSKSRSASRKELLFQHVITENRDQSVLNAYKVKRSIDQMTERPPAHMKIASTAPLPLLPEGKFSHCQGARISPITLTRSQQNLLALTATEPKSSPKTCKPAPVHLRLSSMDNWPESYKKRFFENGGTVHVDIADDPKGVINLLSGTSRDQLNIPGRAADFLSEVQWRMQLRN